MPTPGETVSGAAFATDIRLAKKAAVAVGTTTDTGWAKPLLELLAGIPTVVYGYFAITLLAPLLRGAGQARCLLLLASPAVALVGRGLRVTLHRGLLHEPPGDRATPSLACHAPHLLCVPHSMLRFNSNTLRFGGDEVSQM